MSEQKLKQTDDAVVLGTAAWAIGVLSLGLIHEAGNSLAEHDGEILSNEVVEEMALSEFQRRITSRGGNQ